MVRAAATAPCLHRATDSQVFAVRGAAVAQHLASRIIILELKCNGVSRGFSD